MTKAKDYIRRGYCSQCEMEVDVVVGDFSFSYEYGSERGVHRDFREICAQCGCEMEDES